MFNFIKIIIKYVFNVYSNINNNSNPEINNNTNNLLKDNNNNAENNNILYTELKILNFGEKQDYDSESDEDISKYK